MYTEGVDTETAHDECYDYATSHLYPKPSILKFANCYAKCNNKFPLCGDDPIDNIYIPPPLRMDWPQDPYRGGDNHYNGSTGIGERKPGGD